MTDTIHFQNSLMLNIGRIIAAGIGKHIQQNVPHTKKMTFGIVPERTEEERRDAMLRAAWSGVYGEIQSIGVSGFLNPLGGDWPTFSETAQGLLGFISWQDVEAQIGDCIADGETQSWQWLYERIRQGATLEEVKKEQEIVA